MFKQALNHPSPYPSIYLIISSSLFLKTKKYYFLFSKCFFLFLIFVLFSPTLLHDIYLYVSIKISRTIILNIDYPISFFFFNYSHIFCATLPHLSVPQPCTVQSAPKRSLFRLADYLESSKRALLSAFANQLKERTLTISIREEAERRSVSP